MDGNRNISQSVTVGDTNVAAGGIVITGINQVNLGESEATKLERCRDALFISDPEIDRDELLNFKERTDGTCEWILNDEMYQSWLNSDASQLLWISGGPGRGKTVLSIFLSQELETLAQTRSSHLLYHFHGKQNREYRTTSAILRTFLYQIFSIRLDLAKHAIGRMGTERRMKHTLESPTSLQTILNDVLTDSTLGQVFCLLDGLDEYDGNEKELQTLIMFFQSLTESSSKSPKVMPNTFKLLIFSREMVHLLNCPQLDLELKVDSMTPDVIRFIDSRIKKHPAYKKISQKAWTKFTHTIQQRCNGTFLWAAFVLDEIRLKRTESEIRRVIKNVPAGLEDIYHRILLRIYDDDDRGEVAQLLRWVALTCQALTVSQLAEALYSEDEEKPGDESLQKVEDLVVMSRSLARVEETFGERRVLLIHESVREYLCKAASNKQLPDAFRTNYEEAHLEIAHRCIRALHTIRNGEFLLCQVRESELSSSAWITYATSGWYYHARHSGKLGTGLLDSGLAFFQDPSPLRDAWWHEYSYSLIFLLREVSLPKYIFAENHPPLLQVCIMFRLSPLIDVLVQRIQLGINDIDHMGPKGFTALSYAVVSSSKSLVQLLLDKGASVIAQCVPLGCPLIFAVALGNIGLVKLFLEQLSKTNDPSPVANYGIPSDCVGRLFCDAASSEDTRLLELLLDSGLHTNLKTSAAIYYAVVCKRYGNVLFLLDRSFNPNARFTDGKGVVWQPLHLAAEKFTRDGEVAFEALLRHGAEVNAPLAGDMETPLHRAARSGEPWVVRKLLDHGANTEAKFRNVLRPIQRALCHGDLVSAEMLFEASEDKGDTSLSTVSYWGILMIRVWDWCLGPTPDKCALNAEVAKRLCKRIVQKAFEGVEIDANLKSLLNEELETMVKVLDLASLGSDEARRARFLTPNNPVEWKGLEELTVQILMGKSSVTRQDPEYERQFDVAAMISFATIMRKQCYLEAP